MNIRPTEQSDVPALQTVLSETGLFPAEMLPAMLATYLEGDHSSSLWFTCDLNSAAVGFCYAVPETLTDGTWNMLAIAVHPQTQGQGIGGRLLSAMEAYLKEAGQRLLIVDTSGTPSFSATRRFYEKNGYEKEAVIRDFWAQGDDKVVFRKALNI